LSLELWRDLASVWLAVLCFVAMTVPLVVAVLAVKGMHYAVDRTPKALRVAQTYSRLGRGHVENAAGQVNERVIRVQTGSSRFQTRLRRLFGR
jgi:hypothetical protein